MHHTFNEKNFERHIGLVEGARHREHGVHPCFIFADDHIGVMSAARGKFGGALLGEFWLLVSKLGSQVRIERKIDKYVLL